MKRKEFLNTEETKMSALDSLLLKENKFLKRCIQSLDDQIEDAEDDLKNRLMDGTPIDESVIEILYNTVSVLKARKNMYENFKEEYYNEAG